MSHPLLMEWLGEGAKPVANDVAERRAAICIKCQYNTHPKWWETCFKEPIAQCIRKTIGLKHDMNMKTSHDENLAMCSICACCNVLKVHVPIETIKEHTDEDTMEKWPEWCWIRLESLGNP